jgi:hypothetical protein
LVSLPHAFVAGQEQRLGRGIASLAEQGAAQQRFRPEGGPGVGLLLLQDGHGLTERFLHLGAFLLEEQVPAKAGQGRAVVRGLRPGLGLAARG